MASLLWSKNPYESFTTSFYLISCGIIFLIISQQMDLKWTARVLMSIWISGSLISVVGCGQYLFDFTIIPQSSPPSSTFANRSVAAQYISTMLPFGAYLYIQTKRYDIRSFVVGSALLSTLYLFFSQTRSGWLSLLVSILYLASVYVKSFQGRLKPYLLLPSFTKWIIFSILLIPVSSGIFHLTQKDKLQAITNRFTNYQSTTIRCAVWANCLEMIKERPIKGFGQGNLKVFYPAYQSKKIKDHVFSEYMQVKTAHNDFIQTGVELGCVGLILLAGFLLYWVYKTQVLIRCARNTRIKILGACFTCGFTSLVIHMLFSFPMESALPPLMLFAFAGFILNTCRANNVPVNENGILIPRSGWVLLFFISLSIFFTLIPYHYGRLAYDHHYRKALTYESEKDWQNLIESGLKAISYHPYHKKAYASVGRAYMETNDLENSPQMLNTVIEQYPYDMNALINLSIAYQKKGNSKKALEFLKRAEDIKADEPTVLANTGKIYMLDKDYQNAWDYFNRAKTIDPDNIRLRMNLGFVNIKLKRYFQAIVHYDHIIKLNPGVDVAHLSLAKLYHFYIKDTGKAYYHMRKYIELKPNNRVSEVFRKIMAQQ